MRSPDQGPNPGAPQDGNSPQAQQVPPSEPTDIMSQRLTRRQLLRGGLGLAVAGLGLAATSRAAHGAPLSPADAGAQMGGQTDGPPAAGEAYGAPATAVAAPDRALSVAEAATDAEKLRDVPLRVLANEQGLQIGVAVQHGYNEKILAVDAREFNLAVIDWDMQWAQIEPKKGTLQFDRTDKFVKADTYTNFANANDMNVRGQALLYAQYYPDWLKNGDFSKDELIEITQQHIRDVMTNFQGRINEWVVINEYRPPNWGVDDVLQRVIGREELLALAYQTAREVNPSATLVYNEGAGNHTSQGPATKLTRDVVRFLQSRGLVDKVGISMHADASPVNREDVIATLQSYEIPVAITEFDVNIKDVPGTKDERHAGQAQVYQELFDAVLTSGVCKSVAFYGAGDKFSWLETSPSKNSSPDADPTLFDDNLEPKPAYFAIKEVLQGPVASSSSRT